MVCQSICQTMCENRVMGVTSWQCYTSIDSIQKVPPPPPKTKKQKKHWISFCSEGDMSINARQEKTLTPGPLFHSSETQFPCLQNEDAITYLTRS